MTTSAVGLVSGALLLSLAVSSEAQSPVTDLRALSLKVAEAKVVTELPLSGPHDPQPQSQVRAVEGMKLVAVTLNGTLKAPGRYAVSSEMFAVLFEEDETQSRRMVHVAGAHHVAFGLSGGHVRWVSSYVTDATRPGPVTITFAVTVPAAVENLQVLYATGIGGVVKLAPK